MAGPACLCAGDLQLGCDQVPRCRLAQSFTRASSNSLCARLSQRLNVEYEPLAEQHQQVCKAL